MRRLATIVPTVLGVAVLVFAFLHAVPGDPVEIMLGESAAPADVAAMRHALGLDRPWPAELPRFVGRLARGDLGTSLAYRAPVAGLVAARFPATLELAAAALVLAVGIAIPLGTVAATRPGSLVDRVARGVSLIGVSVPSFVSGPLLVLVFSIALGWLPISGREGPATLVLPAVTLALGMLGILVRLTRTAMLEALSADHLRTARAKGASPLRTTIVHALRSALPPVVTVIGLQAGALLAGAVVTETIFAWPGVGRLLMQAIGARDYPLVQGCVLMIAMTYVVVNLATDVVHGWLDPRVRDDA
ncbi:MAG TPA: ABC transporter permease [Candidatus Eisenbacteria bacterium]|nr:ABC transporter permease [Candidatus Eisenbacteria bacterium]